MGRGRLRGDHGRDRPLAPHRRAPAPRRRKGGPAPASPVAGTGRGNGRRRRRHPPGMGQRRLRNCRASRRRVHRRAPRPHRWRRPSPRQRPVGGAARRRVVVRAPRQRPPAPHRAHARTGARGGRRAGGRAGVAARRQLGNGRRGGRRRRGGHRPDASRRGGRSHASGRSRCASRAGALCRPPRPRCRAHRRVRRVVPAGRAPRRPPSRVQPARCAPLAAAGCGKHGLPRKWRGRPRCDRLASLRRQRGRR